jgi:hypothetical protein
MHETTPQNNNPRKSAVRFILAITFATIIAIIGIANVSAAPSSHLVTDTNTKGSAGSSSQVTSTPTAPNKQTLQDGAPAVPTLCLTHYETFEGGTLDQYHSEVPLCNGGGCGWGIRAEATPIGNGYYEAFAPDVPGTSLQDLVLNQPVQLRDDEQGYFRFSHEFQFEQEGGGGSLYYDGGVLEASTDNGSTWTDTGPNLLTNPYNGTITTCCSNPLGGRQAWVGQSDGFIYSDVRLAPYAGHSIMFRFREGTDESNGSFGWAIDDIIFMIYCQTPTPSNTPSSTPTITFTSTPSPTDTPTPAAYQDVPPDSPFYPFIECLAQAGILNGYPCGGPGEPCNGSNDPYFRPVNPVTRGQLAKIVSQSAGFDDDPVGQTFEDVAPGYTAYVYIERLASRGVMGGYACGGPGEPCGEDNRPYFRPGSGATRGQLTKIVANAAGFTDPAPATYTFADIPVGSTFHQYVEDLLASRPGVMGGYACGGPTEPCDGQNRPYFRPNNGLTRGQTSKIDGNTFFSVCVSERRE